VGDDKDDCVCEFYMSEQPPSCRVSTPQIRPYSNKRATRADARYPPWPSHELAQDLTSLFSFFSLFLLYPFFFFCFCFFIF